jgi:hypothetical protein
MRDQFVFKLLSIHRFQIISEWSMTPKTPAKAAAPLFRAAVQGQHRPTGPELGCTDCPLWCATCKVCSWPSSAHKPTLYGRQHTLSSMCEARFDHAPHSDPSASRSDPPATLTAPNPSTRGSRSHGCLAVGCEPRRCNFRTSAASRRMNSSGDIARGT